ncbi:MAG: hypothetical protein VB120_00020 [Lachnospiraceae bacterium]|nr:hypothetical protein [Lachnospiraceae bacterium]
MKLSRVFKVSGVYVGTVVGAGFASGRELAGFFLKFGDAWFLGIIFAALLFSFLGYGVIALAKDTGAKGYGDFLCHIMGKRLGKAMEIVSGVFLCVLFYAMTAATGALFTEALGISYFAGVLIMLLICFATLLFETKGIVAVNSVLSPLLIISGFAIGLYVFASDGKAQGVPSFENISNLAFSSVIYVSYNIITATAVLVTVKDIVKTKREAFVSSAVSGVALAFLGLAIGSAIYANGKCIDMEIPMLGVVFEHGAAIRLIYIAMLASAIFTTAVGNGFAACSFLAGILGFGKYAIAFIFLSTAFFVSFLGFSGIVDSFYKVFGYIGIVQTIAVALAMVKNK